MTVSMTDAAVYSPADLLTSAEVSGVQALVSGGGKPRHGLMKWQALPLNTLAGVNVGLNGWLAITLKSPVPVMAARIALPQLAAGSAGAVANAAWLQPLPSATPASWPYQINAGDGSGLVNVHSGSGAGNFTFNGIAAGTPVDDSPYPSGTAGSTAICTLPAGSTLASGAIVGIFWSDWLNLKVAPVQASDGFYYYGIAVQAPSGGSTLLGFNTNAGKLKATIQDAAYAAAQALTLTDCYTITNSGAFADWAVSAGTRLTAASSGYFESSPVAAVECMTAARCLNVGLLGDSQPEGYEAGLGGVTKAAYGAIHRACIAASTAAAPVNFINYAMPGRTVIDLAQTWMAGLEQIAPNAAGRGQSSIITGTSRPDVLFIQPWSANDSSAAPTATSIRAGFGKALRMALLCKQSGIFPVLMTVAPASGRYATTQTGADMSPEAARRQCNAMLRAAAANLGFMLFDIDLMCADNTNTPSVIAAAYDCGDGVHFGDAGNALQAVRAQAIITALRDYL